MEDAQAYLRLASVEKKLEEALKGRMTEEEKVTSPTIAGPPSS
jgi:hypothetical protein